MTEQSIVRLATRQDEPQLLDVIRAAHSEVALFSLDEEMVRAMLARAFNREGGIVGVIDGDNEIAAAIYLLLSNFWYSRDSHLEELFNFVRPTYRNRHHLDHLADFAKMCRDKINIPLVIGVLTNKDVEAKVRLYRRKFGLPAGAFFVVGGQWPTETVIDQDLWRVHKRRRHSKQQPLIRKAS